ncbi:protoporphyrinogen oxidase / PPOX [Leishmania donovani]|uniref:Protoporphyrinogen_oxidase-like_protein n=3 Tax=Leishmania donovani species complex TaxID=38574 RepID=A0A6L0WIB9_LEIIN|nr:protoporphyrinogen oxidase-like protein [Leishmania infantum JPCM5]AKK31179.1 protoporphyrinogen oxidase-like protein [Leishmania donovani]CAC9447346.1 protoporphyrinogen_oxidase-like_protein [Leishmania infantum]TPP49705.1 Flavodoxin domain family protein [Leishmania donovani]CAJ1986232.1 protoporphyrinogen oxidase / PPOX [Leishmania donovani]CAM65563.1 protoporphyrinogen oxidase-like protein [Leishmania infantum JPCM5]|eukprot:XP_001463210.1 protoporphyrinogen oxidase-like protein [Leishmania infantum JPCM5]
MASQSPKYLMLYSTTDGHTKTIVDTIATLLTDETKARCDVVDIKDGNSYVLADYEKVLLGGSIRYGHFSAAFIKYVKQHHSELNAMPSAFVSVNLTARKSDKNTATTNVYTRKFLNQSSWSPQLVGVFAGALRYPRYNFFDRVLIQFIMMVTGGETDSTKEIVYTDWGAVRVFASDFAALPLAVPPRPKANAAEKPDGILRSGNGARCLLAIVGMSAAVVVGIRIIVAKRG